MDPLNKTLDENFSLPFEHASKGKRFANSVIDTFSFVILLVIIIALSAYFFPFFLSDEFVDSFAFNLIVYSIYVLIYTLIEHSFSGKTLGKVITRTRAVTIRNERMSFVTALKRNAIRVVPFEHFSFLTGAPGGWHDQWSKTKVILDEGRWNQSGSFSDKIIDDLDFKK